MRNGENNCLDRSDEDPFQEAANNTDKAAIIDFRKLKNCTSWNGYPGLECDGQESRNCISMYIWCKDKFSKECPVLGKGIHTDHLTLCDNRNFWSKQECGKGYIRCQAGNSGQCVKKKHWGVAGAKDWRGNEASCSDGSDLYRPIRNPTKTEESGRQATQADSNEHGSDDGEERINNDESFGKEEENRPAMGAADKRDSAEADGGQHSKPEQVWKTKPVEEWEYNNYKGEEEGAKYVKDNTTNRMVAAPTEETCKANNGFVCKVRLDADDMTSIIMMMTIGMIMAGW